jgi:hypothetical protein
MFLLISVFVALISVLSAVGICDRCRIESGGVYFLLAHTLGSRMGGTLGIIYCFGQVKGLNYYKKIYNIPSYSNCDKETMTTLFIASSELY